MKRFSLSLMLFAVVAMAGCGDETEPAEGGSPEVTPVASFALCSDCGHQAGADDCCSADAEVCASCELHKGSPGCCKMEKGQAGVEICACGHIKGNEKCCKDAADKCAECGMYKGSPGCCQINTSVASKEEANN